MVVSLRTYDLKKSEEIASTQDSITQKELLWQINFLKNYSGKLSKPPSQAQNSLLGQVYHHINIGDYFFFTDEEKAEERYILARSEYIKSIEIAKEENNSYLVCAGLRKLLLLYAITFLDDNSINEYYLEEYKSYAFDLTEERYIPFYKMLFRYYLLLPDKFSWSEQDEQDLREYVKIGSDSILSANIYFLLGSYEIDYKDNTKSAIDFYQKGLDKISMLEIGYAPFLRKRLYTGIISCYIEKKDISSASTLMHEIGVEPRNIHEKYYRRYYHFYQSIIDTAGGNHESGYIHMRRFNSYVEEVSHYNNVYSMQLLEAEYQTNEKERTIGRQKASIIIITIFLSLVVVLSILLWRSRMVVANKNKKIETLMRELHHRVKNNLQVISSLLGLQSMKLEDENAIKAVNEGKSRIRAMSLIHQKLYQTDEVTSLDIREYLTSLIAELVSAYGFQDRIDLEIIAPSESFDADRTLPIGLIINELVSNCFKYAFKDVLDPKLRIELRALQYQYLLIIEDNGPGLPKGFDLKKAESFGLKLVNILVKQMKGTLDYSKEEKSSRFQIQFDLGIHN